ncbi:type II secretion system protein [Nocardioides kongjuensis]|uniref:Prepilin-type N-terminal cleavage/methylation domain-containing protein n=1 Tax=Nocardioides kongjuensis TaxID=349522 RepID=A0A852RBN7_9ACTN|nr:type II secretion system protein [Nocardioides kongjuensis]NYD30547.1 prepilin-type N-terminal cleavage/methylation domain-containing protein [Nocardioides kongjuensis]
MVLDAADHGRDDRGETLVELLVAVVILGIAGVAVMTGLAMTVKASDIQRKSTTNGAYVRSLAEAVQDWVAAGHYAACPAANAYLSPTVRGRLTGLPAGSGLSHDKPLSIGPTGARSACTTDTGVQLVTLHVTSPDATASRKVDEVLTIVVRKPCDPSVAPCTS